MSYTFWHRGILIGESDLEDTSDDPRQRGGVFRPTAHGLSVFPRLTGILSAAHALKAHLDARGLSPDDMHKGEVEEVFGTTPAGQKIIDIGHALSEVEMRAPNGARLGFASIAFTDLQELQRLARELAIDSADDLSNWPADATRYIVSATLAEDTSGWTPAREGRRGGVSQPPWPNDN
jgi:hypothetical protein